MKYDGWTQEDFKRGYELVVGQRNALEEQIIRQFYGIAIRSLCPETGENLDAALKELCKTRDMPTDFMESK